jgi:thiamine biosynthesis lipoprotein
MTRRCLIPWIWAWLQLAAVVGCRRQDAAGEQAEGAGPERRQVPGGTVAVHTFSAMDTVYTVSVGVPGEWSPEIGEKLRAAFARAEAEVRTVERIMSSHRSEGDVHRLNGSAREWVQVERATLDVLVAANRVGHATGGAFDVTWTALRPLYRLKNPHWRPPTDAQVEAARRLVDFRAIELDVKAARVRFTKAGMAVDLGGIAKGHALDLAAESLARDGFPNHLVNGGGDLRVGGARPDRKWRMGIRAPRKDGIHKSGTLRPEDFAMVTSGDYERFRIVDGVRYSHIVDPRTGRSARGAVSVTVIGPQGMLADALATGLFVLGPEEGKKALAHFPGYEAIWIDETENIQSTDGFSAVWDE